jgi:hypothetical protein
MINYDKVKALIDKHDPEARASHAAILQQGEPWCHRRGTVGKACVRPCTNPVPRPTVVTWSINCVMRSANYI